MRMSSNVRPRADIHMADGRVLPARLIGAPPQYDLAVLQVDLDGTTVQALENGTSASLRVGQSVLVIGNPFGLDWTWTAVILSAPDREWRD
jgi:S1-C subfamily serine protease